jgi:hypothetical protein
MNPLTLAEKLDDALRLPSNHVEIRELNARESAFKARRLLMGAMRQADCTELREAHVALSATVDSLDDALERLGA